MQQLGPLKTYAETPQYATEHSNKLNHFDVSLLTVG